MRLTAASKLPEVFD